MRGHVRRRGKGWAYVVELPKQDGKRRQQWQSGFRTERAAEDALAERLVLLRHGIGTELERGTLGEFLMTWLAGRRGIRESTAQSYKSKLETHVLPTLGAIKLQEIRSFDIEALYKAKSKELSPASLLIVDAVLRSAFKAGMERGALAVNPMLVVEKPRLARREMRVWTPDEARAFLRVSDDDRWGAFFRLSLSLGMRRGEVLALRWSDIDLERGWLTISRTLTPGVGGFGVGEVKTPSSRRRLRLDADCVSALRRQRVRVNEQRLRAGIDWVDEGLVFPGRWGGVMNPNRVRHHLHRLAGVAGVPAIRVHDLRHTAATLMVLAGIPLKTVSHTLGHASLAMTADLYLHVIEEMQEQASEAMRRMLDSGT